MAELLDAMAGDQSLFTTADAIERLWEISAPLLVLQQRLVTSGSASVVRFSGGGLAVAPPV